MTSVTGLHHVTINSGHPQENLDFYVAVLGLHLVKRTVNQDAPDTYHLFYADGVGSPGTELTFFPWSGMPVGRAGTGETSEVALAVPSGTMGWWRQRLHAHGVAYTEAPSRFGASTILFHDPHGVRLALVEGDDVREFTPWNAGPVPASHQIRGLHSVRLIVREREETARVLTETMGFQLIGEEAGWWRYGVGRGGPGEIVELRADPSLPRAVQGTGSVHHVAFRIADDAAEVAVQRQVREAGISTTPVIDRFWFHSVYFREPGGVLFELATDGPGFAIDESPEALGERLILAPFLESRRAEIEATLPPITVPTPTASAFDVG